MEGKNFKLICGYENPILENESIKNVWKIKEINFSDLVFDKKFCVYYFNYEKEIKDLKLRAFKKKWRHADNDDDRRKAIDTLREICQVKPDNIKDFELIPLINCLYSIKFKTVIGSNHTKIIQVLHQFIQKDIGSSNHFGEYVLNSIAIYGAKEQVLKEDRTKKFINKARLYKSKNFILNHKYDNIIQLLFPEIFTRE